MDGGAAGICVESMMKILNLNEAAQLLKLNSESLRRIAKRGDIPARKIGKRWVFLESALEDWFLRSYTEDRQLSQSNTEVHSIWQQNHSSPTGKGSGTPISHSKVKEYVKALESQWGLKRLKP